MEEKEVQQEQKKFKKWPILVLILFLLLIVGGSFAWFVLNLNSDKVNVIKSGTLSLELDDETSEGIKLVNAIPMSYSQGIQTVEYTFTLKNTGTITSDYTIYLDNVLTYTNDENVEITITDDTKLEDSKIRYILLKNGEIESSDKTKLLSDATDRVLDSGTIEKNTNITYSLRVWIDSQAETEVMGKLFNAKIRVEASQHQNTVTATTLCARATQKHEEICSQNSTSDYCSSAGYTTGEAIEYGSLGTRGTLATGDAFDCDVDGDGNYGEYDETTGKYNERFYYVSDYYDTTTGEFNENIAVLIYYNNVSSGEANNTESYAYYETAEEAWHGPLTAIKQLPTTTQWSNVNLYNSKRAIKTYTGAGVVGSQTLPTEFSYEGYAARLLTYQEVYKGCYDGTNDIISSSGSLHKCEFLVENTRFSNNSLLNGYWIETIWAWDTNGLYVWGPTRKIATGRVDNSSHGVRPVIEVAKTDIEI